MTVDRWLTVGLLLGVALLGLDLWWRVRKQRRKNLLALVLKKFMGGEL